MKAMNPFTPITLLTALLLAPFTALRATDEARDAKRNFKDRERPKMT